MIKIDKRFILLKFSRLGFEVFIFLTGIFLLINIKNLSFLTYIFWICDILILFDSCISINIFIKYIKNYGREFNNAVEVINWKNEMVEYRWKKKFFWICSFFNLIATIWYFLDREQFNFSMFSPFLLYIILSSFIKVLSSLFFLFLFLVFKVDIWLKERFKRRVNINNIENQNEECSICLENNQEKNWGELDCKHKFHYDCIFEWVNSNPSCPICRTNFLEV